MIRCLIFQAATAAEVARRCNAAMARLRLPKRAVVSVAATEVGDPSGSWLTLTAMFEVTGAAAAEIDARYDALVAGEAAR